MWIAVAVLTLAAPLAAVLAAVHRVRRRPFALELALAFAVLICLETAIVNRTVIGRAEGILMERFDISPDHAFAVLRRVSQHRNVKLNRIAEELVRTRETPR